MPSYIASTVNMIQRAFPHEVPNADYMALLVILYPNISDRKLTAVVCMVTGRDAGRVLNDVYPAGADLAANPAEVARTREKLAAAGLDEWILKIG